jgi:hypothetical protein
MTWKSYLYFVFPVACLITITSAAFSQNAKRRPEMNFERPPLTDINEILTSANPRGFETRPVRFSNVKVQRVLDPQFLLVGPDPQHVLPVMQNGSPTPIRSNSTVEISGVVQQLSRDLEQWNINRQARGVLSNYTVFINAMQIQPRSTE